MDTLDETLPNRIPSELLELQAIVHLLNERLETRAACFYCGEPSECEDHVIPHSLLYHKGVKRTGYERETLPACMECNGVLSSQVHDTMGARKAYLCEKYKRRYASQLRSALWTGEEIAELGYTLQTAALGHNAERVRIDRRLAHLAEIDWPDVPPIVVPPEPKAEPEPDIEEPTEAQYPTRPQWRMRVIKLTAASPRAKQRRAKPSPVPIPRKFRPSYTPAARGKWFQRPDGSWDF